MSIQFVSASRLPRLGRLVDAFGNDAAIRSSTALRGIMWDARAKAMTFSRREPSGGGVSVWIRRGCIGAPLCMSFNQA